MSKNEIMNSSKMTPIEIALDIDSEGMTTAKKLYEFLELNPSNYSKWVKRNIENNPFAESGIDFYSYSSTSKQTSKGRFAKDYKLTAHFAKKLSMKGDSEKAEQAREYFTKVEEKAKMIANNNSSSELLAIANVVTTLANTVSELANAVSSIDERLRKLENQSKYEPLECPELSWYERNKDAIFYVANDRNISAKQVVSMMLGRLGDIYDLKRARQIYREKTGKNPLYDLDVVDFFPNLKKDATVLINGMVRHL